MDKLVSLITAFSVFISSQTATMIHHDQHIVCLDPGHGAEDPGAMYENLKEADITLDIAKKLQTLLEKQNISVIMTRSDNTTNPTNVERATKCNTAKAEVLVSIHLNASSDPTIRYSQGLYGIEKKDKALTDLLHQSLRSELNLPERAEGAVTDFADNVLLKATMPATLQETTFITSDEEYAKLIDGERQIQIAQTLDDGITKWFELQKD